MTKAEIVSKTAKDTYTDKHTASTIVNSFIEIVKESLAEDKNVYLRGFGSFIVKKRAQKKARNIFKNKTIIVPAHKIPAFNPSPNFVNKIK